MKSGIKIFVFSILTGFIFLSNLAAQPGAKPNILFIAVDDLNCDFGAYGNKVVRSPNLDEIASQGMLFSNNHCQQAVCGASRASVLSGFTPEHTGITGFNIYLRDLYPDVVTIPQFFKNEGYTTVGMGKIHDPRNVSETDEVDLVSWTSFINITGSRWLISSGSPVTEMADLPDASYVDGMLAAEGVSQIKTLAAGSQPFFLAVGFKKPHLPFVAPKKYWDLYDRDSISVAPFRKFAENDVAFVYNQGAEFFNSYDDVPPMGEWSNDLQREYIHGYYACVSFIDEQVGKLINELKAQGVYDNTIIVLWGDHGFSLGEHSNWGKHTNFEYSTRCPLLIKAPGMAKGVIYEKPSDLIDIYPTLVDLAGFSVPDTLDGNSLVPVLSGAKERVKEFSVSQFRRDGNQGFVLRSDYYQYVEWTKDNSIQHQQLFNFVNDPFQTSNLFLDPKFQVIIDTFSYNLGRYLLNGTNNKPILLTRNTDSLQLYGKFSNLEFSIMGLDNSGVYPLYEAHVALDKFDLPTSRAGYVYANLQPGKYNYVVEMEDYWPVVGSIDLFADTLVRDTLLRRYYSLQLELIDSLQQTPLIGFDIDVDDVIYRTDLSGMLRLKLDTGEHIIKIISEEYRDVLRQFTLNSDTTIQIRLRDELAFVKFRLKENDIPVVGAEVVMNDETVYTNAIGIAYFESRKVDSTYSYHIYKEDYQDITGSFTLLSDTTIDLQMLPLLLNVEISLVDSMSLEAISQAEVLLNEQLKYSDEEGRVIFFDLVKQVYALEVSKNGYSSIVRSIEIAKDTSIRLLMDKLVSSRENINSGSTVFPNPAATHFYLQDAVNIEEIRILNAQGQLICFSSEIPGSGEIDISFLVDGMYFIVTKNINNQITSSKLFKYKD